MNRLFSAGLSLESARSIIGDGPACGRVAAAVSELDQTILDIRTGLWPATRKTAATPKGLDRAAVPLSVPFQTNQSAIAHRSQRRGSGEGPSYDDADGLPGCDLRC